MDDVVKVSDPYHWMHGEVVSRKKVYDNVVAHVLVRWQSWKAHASDGEAFDLLVPVHMLKLDEKCLFCGGGHPAFDCPNPHHGMMLSEWDRKVDEDGDSYWRCATTGKITYDDPNVSAGRRATWSRSHGGHVELHSVDEACVAIATCGTLCAAWAGWTDVHMGRLVDAIETSGRRLDHLISLNLKYNRPSNLCRTLNVSDRRTTWILMPAQCSAVL